MRHVLYTDSPRLQCSVTFCSDLLTVIMSAVFQLTEEQRAFPCNWTQSHPCGKSNSAPQQQPSEQQPVRPLHRPQSTQSSQRSARLCLFVFTKRVFQTVLLL